MGHGTLGQTWNIKKKIFEQIVRKSVRCPVLETTKTHSFKISHSFNSCLQILTYCRCRCVDNPQSSASIKLFELKILLFLYSFVCSESINAFLWSSRQKAAQLL